MFLSRYVILQLAGLFKSIHQLFGALVYSGRQKMCPDLSWSSSLPRRLFFLFSFACPFSLFAAISSREPGNSSPTVMYVMDRYETNQMYAFQTPLHLLILPSSRRYGPEVPAPYRATFHMFSGPRLVGSLSRVPLLPSSLSERQKRGLVTS